MNLSNQFSKRTKHRYIEIPTKKMLHNIFYFNFIQFNKFLFYTIWVLLLKNLYRHFMNYLNKRFFFLFSIYTCFITLTFFKDNQNEFIYQIRAIFLFWFYITTVFKKINSRQYAITIFFFCCLFIYKRFFFSKLFFPVCFFIFWKSMLL